jgi:hypothetical protein
MSEYQIIEVGMETNGTLVDHIERVKIKGGVVHTVEEIIAFMVTDNFFTLIPRTGTRAEVVRYPEAAPRFIRTKADGTTADNLLKLPRF